MVPHQSGSVWVEGVLNIPTQDRMPVKGKKPHRSPWCLLNRSWYSPEGAALVRRHQQTLLPDQRQGHIKKHLGSSCSYSTSLCIHCIKSIPFMGRNACSPGKTDFSSCCILSWSQESQTSAPQLLGLQLCLPSVILREGRSSQAQWACRFTQDCPWAYVGRSCVAHRVCGRRSYIQGWSTPMLESKLPPPVLSGLCCVLPKRYVEVLILRTWSYLEIRFFTEVIKLRWGH